MPAQAPIHSDAGVESAHPALDMLRLAAPTVATMASYTVMQFTDALMVSRIQPFDTLYLSAQGNGSVWSFVPMALFAGMSGVVNTYVAQNLGAGKPERGPPYAWTAVWMGLLLWAVVLLPLAACMPAIFATMGHEPRLVSLESRYSQILLVGGFITVISRALSQFFYGLHRPGITLTGAVLGNLVNLLGNWALVYGHLGFAPRGVEGAAIATVIGTAVEAAIPLAVFLGPVFHARYATRAAWRPSLAHAKDILRIGWPPAAMFGNEMVCWALFMTYFAGRFGIAENTAGWIVLRYMHLSFMPAVGISFACTAAVGKCLGAARPDLATQRARLGVLMAMGYTACCGLLFVLFRTQVFSVFLPDGTPPAEVAAVEAVGRKIIIVAAVFQVFDGLGISLLGVLRGAGDTVWPGVVAIILSWLCLVGLGGSLSFGVPSLGALGPWLGAGVYIILLGAALGWRFHSGRWKDKNLLTQSAATAVEDPAQEF